MPMLASAGVSAIDFSDALTAGLNGVQIPVALAIWAAPKAVRLVMKFFNSLTH